MEARTRKKHDGTPSLLSNWINGGESSCSPCPWWNSNNYNFDKRRKEVLLHKCNVYGLYQYIKSQHSDGSCVDLSHWPINDDDIKHLMLKLESEPMMKCVFNKNKPETKDSEINDICSIKELKFHSCNYVTDIGVSYLANHWNQRCSGDHKLDEYNDMTETKHVHLISKRPNSLNVNLLSLDLSNCGHITNASCEIIGRHFTKLRALDLSNCINITDEGLFHIMHSCKHLHEIHLKNLVRLQDEGLGYLRQNLVLMKSLRVIGVSYALF